MITMSGDMSMKVPRNRSSTFNSSMMRMGLSESPFIHCTSSAGTLRYASSQPNAAAEPITRSTMDEVRTAESVAPTNSSHGRER